MPTKINKGTIAKEIDGVLEYIYPKTTSDIVEYTSEQSVKDKLDELDTITYDNTAIVSTLLEKIGDESSGIIKDIKDLEDSVTDVNLATTESAGLMSKEDKIKLDGIAEGANKVIVDDALSSESTNPVQNKVVTEALNNKSSINHIHTTVNGHTVESDVPANAVFTDTTYEEATETQAGLMSAEDKTKLDNIANEIIDDVQASTTKTYSSQKITNTYYNKNQVDTIFSQIGWTGTLEQYETMLLHNPGMIYTAVDTEGNIRRFLGDVELKFNTTIGTCRSVTYGTASSNIGMGEEIGNI